MMRVRRFWSAAIAGLLAASVAADAHAALLYEYNANATTPAVAPETGGIFTRGGTNHADITTVGPGNELGTNYWEVVDTNPMAPTRNSGVFYFRNLTLAEQSDPGGWWGRMVVRIPSASEHGSGTVLEIRNAADYYGISLVNNGASEYIGYHNALGTLTKLADADLDTDYVTIDAAFDPGSLLVSVYLDGGLIGTISQADAPNTGIRRFGFGSNTSAATTTQHWALVQVHSGAIPEPSSLALFAVGALFLSRRWARRS